ncbi:ce58a65a-c5e1-4037-abd6-1287b4daea91 [Thermothielavioides terrestris]|uniref:Ce58a65a-c5e1-4037-abd6-1287b4daea91 n=1 Tax=Thermothielavioides terrestris TaxID=2587410 RepID=A0A3S4EZX3_9PEZI|nr:ce58a65a-c5e1-4037-abd6-1287b4daea91 [Thermothielavioides terrestris]
MERQSTPPTQATSELRRPPSPPTPEVTRRIEESRLRAKAIRGQREAEQRSAGVPPEPRTASGFIATDDIQLGGPADDGGAGANDLRPISRKFSKYVDYNFSAMTDTKGAS